jgi:hypothetical protein
MYNDEGLQNSRRALVHKFCFVKPFNYFRYCLDDQLCFVTVLFSPWTNVDFHHDKKAYQF